MLKRKLYYVNNANTKKITLCELNNVHYTEMETCDLVSIMATDIPKVRYVELLEHSVKDSVMSDMFDTEVDNPNTSSKLNQCEE